MIPHLQQFWHSAKVNKRFTMLQFKQEFVQRYGYYFTDKELEDGFRDFRTEWNKENEVKICKIKEMGKWKYIKTSNKCCIIKHNYYLRKELRAIKNREIV